MNVQVTARVPKEIRDEAEKIYAQYGFDINDAIRILLTTSVKEQRFPIDVSKPVNLLKQNLGSMLNAAIHDKIKESKIKELYAYDSDGNPTLRQSDWDLPGDEIYDKIYGSLLND